MFINYIVMGMYLALIVFIGYYFRKENNNISDYLRARGRLPWLFVGASAYVSQFSAWTFTVGAAEAYTNGYNILIVFWANALSFFIAGSYFAKKFRQMRINSPMEAVTLRFGSQNSKLFAIASIPNFLFYPAIWLNSLVVFISAGLGFNTRTMIFIVGGITILMSIVGGTWAIISSDLLQMIIITVISTIVTIFAFVKFNEIGGIFQNIPLARNFQPATSSNIMLYVLWIGYMFLQKFLLTNNFQNSFRFNASESSISASKAAFFACGIYLLGTIIWFVPSWYMSTQVQDLSTLYPHLAKPAQASYLAFVQNYMPVGVLGIIIVMLFAATMSSIDSSLNWCTGFVMSLLNKKHKNNILLGRLCTLLFGIIIIALTLYYDSLWDISFFDLTYKLITYIYLPIVIPLFISLWLKKTPDWGFVLSIGVGFLLSWYLARNKEIWNVLLSTFFHITEPTRQDISHISLVGGLLLQCVGTGGVFLLSSLFFKGYTEKRAADVGVFYRRLARPVHVNVSGIKRVQPKINFVYLLSVIIICILIEFILLSNTVLWFTIASIATISTSVFVYRRIYLY